MGRLITTLLAMGLIPTAMAAASSSSSSSQAQAQESFKNITLHSPIMSARLFMPMGKNESADDNDNYYIGSRFEHGSMIGDIVFGGNREVYGRGLWRTPHDPSWPESGTGLASEFGCGANKAACEGKGDITNGVLGHEEAKAGEPFLKIGVGALIKGSCPECVGEKEDEYRFNSPYKFYRPPSWKIMPSPDPNEVTFVSEETLGDYGYRIQKTARLDGNILTVRSILTNLGKKQFTTPWYSHHFFTGGNDPVGPGYELDLGLSEYALRTPTPQYKQPGIIKGWSGEISDYVNVTMARDGSISMSMKKAIPEGVRLKAEFLDESRVTLTDGSFTLHAPNGISVSENIPELQTQSRNPFIYAYNVYMERGTISPEPTLLLYLQPDETTFWTQHLKFSSDRNPGGFLFLSMFTTRAWQIPTHFSSALGFMLLGVCLGLILTSYTRYAGSRRRIEYSSIPDQELQKQEVGDVLRVV